MPGSDAEVPVQGAGGLVPDPDHPGPAALATDGDFAVPEIEVAAAAVVRVVEDPGQLRGPDPGRGEHRDDRGVAPLGECPSLAGFLQGR
jgi:hypothetical protein